MDCNGITNTVCTQCRAQRGRNDEFVATAYAALFFFASLNKERNYYNFKESFQAVHDLNK